VKKEKKKEGEKEFRENERKPFKNVFRGRKPFENVYG